MLLLSSHHARLALLLNINSPDFWRSWSSLHCWGLFQSVIVICQNLLLKVCFGRGVFPIPLKVFSAFAFAFLRSTASPRMPDFCSRLSPPAIPALTVSNQTGSRQPCLGVFLKKEQDWRWGKSDKIWHGKRCRPTFKGKSKSGEILQGNWEPLKQQICEALASLWSGFIKLALKPLLWPPMGALTTSAVVTAPRRVTV